MGATSPAILKSRRATCKCDICGRGFLSVQALRTHQSFTHPKARQRVAYKPNVEVLAERNLMNVKIAKATTPMPVEKKNDEENDPTRLEFGCPKCNKSFAAYFHAVNHIQKTHCVNSKGEPVPLNSTELIKPVRTVVCVACNTSIGDKKHVCTARDNYVDQAQSGMKCLGCWKEYCRMTLYDLHISGIHSKDVLTLFFTQASDFTTWKWHMESQMRCSYIIVSEFVGSEKSVHKKLYRCPNYIPNFHEEMTGFCPSSIIVQEFPKGYQVHFYKEHYGHASNVRPYKLDAAYKKYSINHLMSVKDLLDKEKHTDEKQTPGKEKDMYSDFKKMMLNIISEAEKVDDDCLKNLFGKALEMSVVLNNRDETEKKPSLDKNVTDDKISFVLNKVETRSKRKQDLNKSTNDSAKKPKNDENSDSFIKKINSMRSQTNFNDTFKDFVGSIGCKVDGSPITKNDKKKDVVKTKIGQFKPSPPKVKKKEENKPKSEDKFQLAKVKNEVKFDQSNVKSEFKFDVSKIKTEIEYEVREQENDCNILILKI
ncbi:hypothetical protein K1T71_015163 [Dendrolimus kikuchii]|nr:hypothetical protein K1T71_015163 [Dendrolimus kikuchii]